MDRHIRKEMMLAARTAPIGEYSVFGGAVVTDLRYEGGCGGYDETSHYGGGFLLGESMGAPFRRFIVACNPLRVLSLLAWADREFERGRQHGLRQALDEIEISATAQSAMKNIGAAQKWKEDGWLTREQQEYEAARDDFQAREDAARNAIQRAEIAGDYGKADELIEQIGDSARDRRAEDLERWSLECFGKEQTRSVQHRALRFLEEAFEAVRAAGLSRELAFACFEDVYGRSAGELDQEIGGCGVTLLLLARAAGLSADVEERREIERILSKPKEHFQRRNQAKIDRGLVGIPMEGGGVEYTDGKPLNEDDEDVHLAAELAGYEIGAGPYRVYVDKQPCDDCGAGAQYGVLNPEGVGEGITFAEIGLAADHARDLNAAWEYGTKADALAKATAEGNAGNGLPEDSKAMLLAPVQELPPGMAEKMIEHAKTLGETRDPSSADLDAVAAEQHSREATMHERAEAAEQRIAARQQPPYTPYGTEDR